MEQVLTFRIFLSLSSQVAEEVPALKDEAATLGNPTAEEVPAELTSSPA